MAIFVDAACVHPEVVVPIFSRLFSTELDLLVALLLLALTTINVSKGDFFVIVIPGMGHDYIERDISMVT